MKGGSEKTLQKNYLESFRKYSFGSEKRHLQMEWKVFKFMKDLQGFEN